MDRSDPSVIFLQPFRSKYLIAGLWVDISRTAVSPSCTHSPKASPSKLGHFRISCDTQLFFTFLIPLRSRNLSLSHCWLASIMASFVNYFVWRICFKKEALKKDQIFIYSVAIADVKANQVSAVSSDVEYGHGRKMQTTRYFQVC